MSKGTYREPSSSISTAIWPQAKEMGDIHSRISQTSSPPWVVSASLQMTPSWCTTTRAERWRHACGGCWSRSAIPAGVRVLDGGLQDWVGHGFPIDTGSVTPEPAAYREVAGYTGVVRHDDLQGRFLADLRSPERYRGETEPIDPKAGHIPGAVNYPLSGNLDDGRFRASRELADAYRDFPSDGVVSCGSGVNACHGALALVIAGRPMPDVYIGSFSDWSRRDLPVSTGPKP